MVVWVAVLLVQLAAYLLVNGLPDRRRMILQLPQPMVRKIIHDGNNRPVLSIAGVKAGYYEWDIPTYSGQKDGPVDVPFLDISFRNDGNTSARLTKAAPKISLPSGGCDLSFESDEKVGMNIVIPPGYEDHTLFLVNARPPCKTSGLIKLTVVYTNLASGIEYTQELSTSADLVFGDQPAQ
jgi:hypothetical protein